MPRPSLPGPRGITWYTFRVHLPEPLPAEPLALLTGPLFPACGVFANGREIGQFGGPFGDPYGQLYARPASLPVPHETDPVIAIRGEDWNLSSPCLGLNDPSNRRTVSYSPSVRRHLPDPSCKSGRTDDVFQFRMARPSSAGEVLAHPSGLWRLHRGKPGLLLDSDTHRTRRIGGGDLAPWEIGLRSV